MKQEELKDKLDLYANVYNDAKKKVGPEAAIAIVDQIGKHLRIAEMRDRIASGNGAFTGNAGAANGDEPATERQLAFLKDLGIEAPSGISKREASAKLDEALAR